MDQLEHLKYHTIQNSINLYHNLTMLHEDITNDSKDDDKQYWIEEIKYLKRRHVLEVLSIAIGAVDYQDMLENFLEDISSKADTTLCAFDFQDHIELLLKKIEKGK